MTQSGYLSDEEYRAIYSRVPRLCIDLAIVGDAGILLTKRDIEPAKGYWHTPGGRVRYEETIEKAAARIALEEVGISIELGKLIGFMEFFRERDFVHSTSMVFLARKVGGTARGSSQAAEVKVWQSLPSDMHSLHKKFYEEHWQVITDAMNRMV